MTGVGVVRKLPIIYAIRTVYTGAGPGRIPRVVGFFVYFTFCAGLTRNFPLRKTVFRVYVRYHVGVERKIVTDKCGSGVGRTGRTRLRSTIVIICPTSGALVPIITSRRVCMTGDTPASTPSMGLTVACVCVFMGVVGKCDLV